MTYICLSNGQVLYNFEHSLTEFSPACQPPRVQNLEPRPTSPRVNGVKHLQNETPHASPAHRARSKRKGSKTDNTPFKQQRCHSHAQRRPIQFRIAEQGPAQGNHCRLLEPVRVLQNQV